MTPRSATFGSLLPSLALTLFAPPAHAQPSPAALSAFHTYTAQVETRLDAQHRSHATFLVRAGLLAAGEVRIEDLCPPEAIPGALLHHWRATTLLPGAGVAGFESLLRDLPAYPRVFAPRVLAARVLFSSPDRMEATLRVREKHVLTVVLDTTYDIRFGRLDAGDGWSSSRSTRVDEVAAPGTPDEHPLAPGAQHGFLWCQHTWWSYSQTPGGLLVQVESVSLSRAVPAGLGWAVRPFVQSVPRDSLTFTLDRAAAALQK